MPRLAVLFPGQGSQYIGMAKPLCSEYRVARQVYEEANDILGWDLRNICWEGNINELTRTDNAQLAILVHSVAAYRVFQDILDFNPELAAGHSLGEFTALTCSGAVSFSDVLRIVKIRGRLMQECSAKQAGSMLAVNGIDAEQVEEMCESLRRQGYSIFMSCHNSINQIIVSGCPNALRQMEFLINQTNGYAVMLKVGGPFHSPLMHEAALQFKEELKNFHFCSFTYPVLSNVTAQPYNRREEITSLLVRQMTQTVQWHSIMEYIQHEGIEYVLELGPNTVLRNLFKKGYARINAYSLDDSSDFQLLLSNYKKNSQSTTPEQAKKFVNRCLATAVCLQNYNFDEEEYHQEVVIPYRKVCELLQHWDSDQGSPYAKMEQAYHMLQHVSAYKNVPLKEQQKRIEELINETGVRGLYPDLVF